VSVDKECQSVMPDLIRYPEAFQKTGFRLEFIPMKIGAGMTHLYENRNLWQRSCDET
jgi:hypothetical protein